jgi:hypothetical protein
VELEEAISRMSGIGTVILATHYWQLWEKNEEAGGKIDAEE